MTKPCGEQKRATEINHFATPWPLGDAYIHRQQYDAASNELRARAEVQPQDLMVQFSLPEACQFKGMKNEAARHEEQAFLAAGDKKSAEPSYRAIVKSGLPPAY
jgi:hypothetical protein